MLYAVARSNQTAERLNLFVFAAFLSFQTKGMCFQQPGTLTVHPFCIDNSIILTCFF